MAKHITIHVDITETQEEERDQYGNVKQSRNVTKLAEFTVRADTVASAHVKVAAIMAGALPDNG